MEILSIIRDIVINFIESIADRLKDAWKEKKGGLMENTILDDFPENLYLYKDSGLWVVFNDLSVEELKFDTLYEQGVNENVEDFFIRVIKMEEK